MNASRVASTALRPRQCSGFCLGGWVGGVGGERGGWIERYSMLGVVTWWVGG